MVLLAHVGQALPAQHPLGHSPLRPQHHMDLPAPLRVILGCTHKQNARLIGKLEVKQRHLMSPGAFGLGPCVPAVLPAVGCVSGGVPLLWARAQPFFHLGLQA